jgi:hypothetical protein
MQDRRDELTQDSGSPDRPAPTQILRSAGLGEDEIERVIAAHHGNVSFPLAMNLAAYYERIVAGGVPPREAARLTSSQTAHDVSAPHERADEAIRSLREARSQGESKSRDSGSRASESARPTPIEGIQYRKGDRTMTSSEQQHETDSMARAERDRWSQEREQERERERLARERERLERERERLEQEHERACERLEKEREKLEHLQEEIEARIEKQQERLEELQEALDAREEELEEREEELEQAAEEMEELEIDGAEGVREVLDVVSQRIPTLMRGIRESVYSPEAMKSTAESLATFFKSLVDVGMDPDEATAMTKLQMLHIQSQGLLTNAPYRTARGRPARPARPTRPTDPVPEARAASEECDEEGEA